MKCIFFAENLVGEIKYFLEKKEWVLITDNLLFDGRKRKKKELKCINIKK